MKIVPPDYCLRLLEEIGGCADGLKIKAVAVGGCVRDWSMGAQTKDIDIMCWPAAAPLATTVAQRYGAEKKEHGRFGTASVALPGGFKIDFAGARKEVYEKSAALPNVSAGTIESDFVRRDFSVNALGVAINKADDWRVYDNFNGLQDIKRGLLRILHPRSFEDDPTRLYRACRFAGRFGWKLEAETAMLFEKAVAQKLPQLLSRERLRQELLLILAEKNPAPAFAMMDKSGLSEFVFPALKWDSRALAAADVFARLGIIAASCGDGTTFLKSLNLRREMFLELSFIVTVLSDRKSPTKSLSGRQAEIASAVFPGMPSAALQKRIVDSALLSRANIQREKYSAIMERAAAAQWQGVFSDIEQASRWIDSCK